MYQAKVLHVRSGRARCELFEDEPILVRGYATLLSRGRITLSPEVTQKYALRTGDRFYLVNRYHKPIRSSDIRKVETQKQIQARIREEAWNHVLGH